MSIDCAKADSWLRRHRVGEDELLVGIHPGGEGLWGRKQWSVERFARVADGLADRAGARIVIMGGRDDAKLASELAGMTHACIINAVGQTTLGETAGDTLSMSLGSLKFQACFCDVSLAAHFGHRHLDRRNRVNRNLLFQTSNVLRAWLVTR